MAATAGHGGPPRLRQRIPVKVLLANDTGRVPHLGCKAVSNAHARLLGRYGHEVAHRRFLEPTPATEVNTDDAQVRLLEADEHLTACIDDVDAVIVNGEGTLHHGAGRHLLALLALAQRRHKATLLVNAVFQDTTGFDETLLNLDDFTVRDAWSLHHATARGFAARMVPDSYFAAGFSGQPFPLAGDVVTDWHWQRGDVGAALERYAQDRSTAFLPFVTPSADALWPGVPGNLATARVVLTGRHHGVCAAILAGRPFVAMPSNSFKIEGLLLALGLTNLLATDYDSLLRARDWAVDHEELFASLLDRLTGGEPLTTFRRLGISGANREDLEVVRLAEDLRRPAAGA
jgi:hypothetical protein